MIYEKQLVSVTCPCGTKIHIDISEELARMVAIAWDEVQCVVPEHHERYWKDMPAEEQLRRTNECLERFEFQRTLR